MNEDYESPMADVEREPDPDPRVITMQRVVDLERQHESAVREVEYRQKKAAILGEELSGARDELYSLLGLSSKGMNVAPMSDREAKRIAFERSTR